MESISLFRHSAVRVLNQVETRLYKLHDLILSVEKSNPRFPEPLWNKTVVTLANISLILRYFFYFLKGEIEQNMQRVKVSILNFVYLVPANLV